MELLLRIAADWQSGMQERLALFIVALLLGSVAGELPARISGLYGLGRAALSRMGVFQARLDKPGRSAATLVYRGMVVLGVALVPACIIGAGIDRFWLLQGLVITALSGVLLAQPALYRQWRQARRGALALVSADPGFLFRDGHGVIRYRIIAGTEGFAAMVGGACWFALGGVMLLLPYLLLGALARQPRSFALGWAVRGVWRGMHLLPALLAALLLVLAGCFTPGAKPLAGFRARTLVGCVAHLIGVSLGGTLPFGRTLAWVGGGTPTPGAAHLGRFFVLHSVALIWLVLGMAGMLAGLS